MICDPACGTGGFLVAAHGSLVEEMGGTFDRDGANRVKRQTDYEAELVSPVRVGSRS